MKYFANIAVAVIFALLSRAVDAQQSVSPTTPPDSARLSGIVQDSASQPISDVEIALSNAPTAAHTDARGRFTIAAPPGNHEMIFRKVGWQSVRYTWVAQAAADTEIVIVLRTLPHTLEPVVVRERENAIFKGTASLPGSDLSGTVGARMESIPRCRTGFGGRFDHPTYYVIWLRGRS